MHVDIIQLDKDLPLPKYESTGAAAFDILVSQAATVQPGNITLLHTGVVIKTPKNHMLMIAPRSSLPRKKLLVFPHSIGIIDQDYCGPEDEVLLQVQNIGTEPITIERGEKIAQGVFVQISKATWNPVDDHGTETRGGFGSTDV